MGLHTKPSSLSFFSLSLLLLLLLFTTTTTTLVKFVHAKTGSGITNLVYKGCADQNFPDTTTGNVYTENLKALLSSLVSQSSQKKYATTTSGDGQTAMIGLYQCRGDLTTPQCYTCVSKIPDLASKLCGKAVAARVQLSGCYLRYEVMGFGQVPETELLYKFCGSKQVSEVGFEEKRDEAFDMLTNGVKNSGGELFYTGSYQQVYVLGQCEGDLSSGDCVDCVKAATGSAKNECGNSISVQVYLHKCFISYSYYPNGVPNPDSSSSSSSSGGTRQQHTQKTVAMSIGIVAAVGFVIVLLLFLKSVLKKKRPEY